MLGASEVARASGLGTRHRRAEVQSIHSQPGIGLLPAGAEPLEASARGRKPDGCGKRVVPMRHATFNLARNPPDMLTTYQLGPLPFSLDGRHPRRAFLDREFGTLKPADSSPRLRFRFADSLDVPRDTTQISSLAFFDGGFVSREGELQYLVRNRAGALDVVVAPSRSRRGFERASRFFDWN